MRPPEDPALRRGRRERLRHADQNLRRSLTPGNDPARAFPRLTTCLTALDALNADPQADQRRLLDTLYDAVIARRALFGLPASVGGLLPAPFAGAVKVILQEPLLRWSYGLWLRRTRLLRWVPAMTGDDQNVLAYLCSRDPDQRDRYRERILAEALLREMGRQLRPSIYSVNFLRRHRGVVLFRRAEPGGAQWTFIEKLP